MNWHQFFWASCYLAFSTLTFHNKDIIQKNTAFLLSIFCSIGTDGERRTAGNLRLLFIKQRPLSSHFTADGGIYKGPTSLV